MVIMGGGASSSSSSKGRDNRLRCLHCNFKTTSFTQGWQLNSGCLANLCHRCGVHYQNGTFCETFHRTSDGWRCCVGCYKRVHCGCIVSQKDIYLMDGGDVCCKDCATLEYE